MKATKKTEVYACGYCGKLYRREEDADYCHSDRVCKTCGIVIGKNDYYTSCEKCRVIERQEKELERFNKAEKLTIEEYLEKHPHGYAVHSGDKYFDIEDVEYEFDDIDMPDYVWGTDVKEIKLDYYNIAQGFEEDVEWDDYEMGSDALASLHDFCSKWNKKFSQDVYYETSKIAILLKEKS